MEKKGETAGSCKRPQEAASCSLRRCCACAVALVALGEARFGETKRWWQGTLLAKGGCVASAAANATHFRP
eukprot:15219704-Alexandrium_andersonii.AAC.1